MFSIVVANWNGEKFLKRFFDSLTAQTYTNFAVYFIDNGSSDNSKSIVDAYKDKLVIHYIPLDKNYGFTKANNVGIEKAMEDSHAYIMTLNNDLELMPDCLENARHMIEGNPQADLFQLFMVNYYDRDTIDAAGLSFRPNLLVRQVGFGTPVSQADSLPVKIDGVCAGAAVYSKKALEDVKDENGYFCTPFFAYYEDVDLSWRLKAKGYRALLCKDARVFHVHSGSSQKESPFKAYYMSRNYLWYLEKNQESAAFQRNKKRYYVSLYKYMVKLTLKGKYDCVSAYRKGIKDFKREIKK